MERVTFLVEDTNERVSCLLNPETVTIRRWSGISDLSRHIAPMSAANLSDTPVAMTGGGRTELELQLLFDVSINARPEVVDVRTLTLPLWRLSENAVRSGERQVVPKVWILWGREWTFLCVIETIAERFEQMTAAGAPQRSWISLRARRVPDTTVQPDGEVAGVPSTKPTRTVETRDVVIATGDGGMDDDYSGVRVDDVANQLSGDPTNWRAVCEANNVDDPLRIPAGTVLRTPPAGDGS